MVREGSLYRVVGGNTFMHGSIVRVVFDTEDDIFPCTVVLGDVVDSLRLTYEKPGFRYDGPYIYEDLEHLAPLED